jgi:hypothetical protein
MPNKNDRISVSLETIMESTSGKREARISDISIGGCYVDTIVTASVGEDVTVTVRTPTGEWMKLPGEVMYCFPGMGFGLRFRDLAESDRALLEQFLRSQGWTPDAVPE